jgi:hypothetical protein
MASKTATSSYPDGLPANTQDPPQYPADQWYSPYGDALFIIVQ